MYLFFLPCSEVPDKKQTAIMMHPQNDFASRALLILFLLSSFANVSFAFQREQHAQVTGNDNAFLLSSYVPFHRSATQASLHMSSPLGDFFRNFGQELDNFIDDAMDRKLGGGSTFYGERKSSFSSNNKKSFKDTSAAEAAKRDEARRHVFLDAEGNRRRGGEITGEELRDIIIDQWGQPYPVLIKRRRDALGEPRLYLVIQWKPLGKKNLKLTEEEYLLESDAVADLISDWGVANQARNEIFDSGHIKPKTMTQQYPGLFIALDVEEDIVATF